MGFLKNNKNSLSSNDEVLVSNNRRRILFKKSNNKFLNKHPIIKDILSLLFFVIIIIIGTLILNAFVFRSYNVVGGSMENTLHEKDRIIVNRVPVTVSHFLGKEYVPNRGDIIVFANGSPEGKVTCVPPADQQNQFIVKRVIAFPGEKVKVTDGFVWVYNDEHPEGFDPDNETRKSPDEGPKKWTTGEHYITVPEGELYVIGDNREKPEASHDSRNGLGTIPLCRVIGPVSFRLYPFDKLKIF